MSDEPLTPKELKRKLFWNDVLAAVICACVIMVVWHLTGCDVGPSSFTRAERFQLAKRCTDAGMIPDIGSITAECIIPAIADQKDSP